MRSDLIFGALTHVTNRYELCQLASKATRKLHKPNTRCRTPPTSAGPVQGHRADECGTPCGPECKFRGTPRGLVRAAHAALRRIPKNNPRFTLPFPHRIIQSIP